ncbi:MAG: hypothetical protein IPJ50_21050 [Betaproteobacteria bacterium]|nr:hypothetical protein [Betaproteobacteria bacterium]
MPPVVDGLMADAALMANPHSDAFLARINNPDAQSRIPPGMIDRQLEQRFAFAGPGSGQFSSDAFRSQVLTHKSKFQSSFDGLLRKRFDV